MTSDFITRLDLDPYLNYVASQTPLKTPRLHDPSATLSIDMKERVRMMNPMCFIGTSSSDVAPHWFIRHGAKDRDTSFLVPINLATRLMNCGYDVDFFLSWNRPHSGDYNLDDLFGWLNPLTGVR